MTGVHGLWFVGVLLFVTSTTLVTVAHAQQCYNKTILCENFTTDGNNCSSNIERFVVQRTPGLPGSTGFEPQYQIQLILRHAIPRDTDVKVVTCSSPSECNIDNIIADSFLGDSSCVCQVPFGILMMRGITCRFRSEDFCQESTTLLRFTRTSHCSEGPENVIMILAMEETECDNCAALPANTNCSTSEHFGRCLLACSDYDPLDKSSSCYDVCDDFIKGFCDMNCTTTDNDSLRRCQLMCSDEFYDAVNLTCTPNPCTDSLIERSENESEISVLDSLRCLPSCLQDDIRNTSCSETLCSSLLEDCESPLYDLDCEENGNRPPCRLLCRRNGTVNSLVNQQCSDEQIEVFCGEEFEDGECDDLPLFNEDCDERRRTCILMCTGNMRTLDRRCRQQVRHFCFRFLQDLLQEGGTDFNTTNVRSAIRVLRKSTITSELSETLGGMRSLFRYFEDFTTETRQFVELQEDTVGELMEVFDDLFDETRIDQWNNLAQDGIDSSESLQNAENLAGIVGQSMTSSNNAPFMFLGQNLGFWKIVVCELKSNRSGVDGVHMMRADSPVLTNIDGGMYVFSANNVSNLTGARMEVPLKLLCEDGIIDGCSTVVSSMLVNNLATYLNNDIPENVSNGTVNSILLSTQVFGAPNLSSAIFDYPIKFFFTPLESNGSFELNNSKCVYWDFNTSHWSADGITTKIVNSSVLCISNHLTSFAVLVQVTSEDDGQSASEKALSVVSYVGCAISILSLILTIILLLAFRKSLNKGALLYIHLNLAIALLIALFIFVAGIETAIAIPWLCTTITALLHYFFLCVFCWMLAEGIMLYLLVVRVFGKAAQKWYYLLILGWGLPVPIVAISAGILHEDYGTTTYCWIKPDPTSATIWTFVGPMIIMVLINSVILVMTIVSMVRGRMHGGAEQGVKTRELVKSTLKATIILLPLMGVTWVIGLFAVDKNTEVFAWLFTIFNSLQGLFILIFHVLRNEVVLGKVKKHVKRCITCIAGAKEDHKSFTNGTGTKETRLGSTSGLHPLDDIAKDAKSSSYEFVIKNGLHAIDSTDDILKATCHLDKC